MIAGTLLTFAVLLPTLLIAQPARAQTISFMATELLGTPTDTSVTVNIIPAETVQMFFEYGTTNGGPYTNQTPTLTATANVAHEVEITGLQPNTRYFYRTRYIHPNQPGTTEARPQGTFHTARPPGEAFTFDIIADAHIGIPGQNIAATLGNSGVYNAAVGNIAADQPDFVLDLGDAFLLNDSTTQARADEVYTTQRGFMDGFSGSSPVFVMGGNHENEEGWNLDDAPAAANKALNGIRARKEFYPTPVDQGPSGFYSGNTDPLAAIGADPHSSARNNLREDYYSFEWGDALFVVLDPFQYTMDMPYACNTAGEVCTDSTPNEVGNQGDQWNWTLGDQQYFWFRDQLEDSDAKFKFVFSHHVTGGMVNVGGGAGGPNYVRGGAAAANFFEWGGRNAAGDYVFDTMRPGWGKPPHQLMIDEGVTAFYHGHDHVYALEEADEVIYHEIPHVSVDGGLGFGLYSVADPFTTMVIENGGHLRVTVDPDAGAEGEALAEYVRASTDGNPVNGSVAHSYVMTPRAAATPVPGPPIYRVNTGGATLAATDGGDPFLGLTAAGTSIPGLTLSGNVTGPTTNTNTFAPLPVGVPNALYQSTLHTPTGNDAGTGQLNFDFVVPAPGDYEVKLFFGENAAAITGPDQREFDVALEGATVLDNYDIWETVGALNIPDTQTFTTTVNDGVLDFDLIAQVNIAGIRGIQISPIGEPTSNVAPTISATPNPASAVAGQTTVVDLTTNDANGDIVTTDIIGINPGFAALVGGELQLTPDAGDIAGSPHTVTVQATDGELTSSVDVIVNVNDGSTPIYRVNTGGATVAATDGGDPWLGLTAAGAPAAIPGLTLSGNVTGPTTNTNTFAPLTDGAPNALYQSTLHTPTGNDAGTGQLNFDFVVPAPGDYEVKLFFGENAAAITGPDQREFDVALEGATVLDNYDIWETVGALNIPDIQTLETTVTDGVLDFDLIAQVNIAGIRGIQIRPLIEPGTNLPPTISATPNPASAVVGQTTVVNLTTNDANGDIVTTEIVGINPGFAALVGGELELTPDAGDVAGSPHMVTVQASDGELTSNVIVTVNVVEPSDYLYRVNAGGEDVGDHLGITAAPGTIPGLVLSGDIGGTVDIRDDADIPDEVDMSNVDPTLPEALFQTTLWTTDGGAGYNWDFTVPDGTYLVDLHWMEHNFEVITAPGQRLIDVFIEGTQVLDDFDELGTVGGVYNVAQTTQFEATVSDGVLNIFIIPELSVGNIRGIDIRPLVAPEPGTTPGDFDGDGDSDVGVFRPSSAQWFVQPSGGFGGIATTWGAAGDIPVSGDFNGDGTGDVAVFRPSTQSWFVQPNSGFPAGLATAWGVAGDIPIPADFNGDGITDIAVFRPSDQTWYAQPNSGLPAGLATQWGVAGDVPVPADFDGDGVDEVAVYRPSDQTWYSQTSGLATQWGVTGDIPVPVDFDGDGSDEVAVYRPSDQTWYSQSSGLATQWGAAGDVAVAADYDGDGTADVAVYRPSDATWYVQGGVATQWGTPGDLPVHIPHAIRQLYP